MTGHRIVALDTSTFIYELEENPRYAGLTRPLFERILAGSYLAVTSTLMMTELLVKPYRDNGSAKGAAVFHAISQYPNLEWIAPDLQISDLAARFRAKHRLHTPDAILAATAVLAGATCLVGNDPAFRRVPDFKTVLLDDLL